MEVLVNRLPKSKAELEIKIPAAEFDKFREKAVFNLGKDLEVSGFRKGKAPKEIIEKEIGQKKILDEAAEIAIKESYPKAVLENKVEAISRPEIEILKLAQGNPFEFKARIWVMPEIKLPDYRKVASQIRKREVEVTKEEIEKLRLEKERIEKERVRQEIIEKIAKESELEIPEVLVKEEQRRIMERIKTVVPQTLQISFEDYLKKLGKSEQELFASFLGEAEQKVKNFLVLKEIGKKENIKPSEEEIEEEVKKVLKQYPNSEKSNNFDLEQLKSYTKEIIKTEKIFQFLENLLKLT